MSRSTLGKGLLAVSLCLSTLAVPFTINAQTRPVILRLAEVHPAEHPTTKGDFDFARRVNELTQGRIQVEIYHSGVLGDELSVLEQVQFGGIDLGRVSVASVEPSVPLLAALFMPYLYRDADHMWSVLTGPIGRQLLDELQTGRFVGIGWFEAGARSFYTNRKVHKVADLAGLTIRVQESPPMVALVEAFGIKAQPMAFSGVYPALRTGALDGAENNIPTYFASGHYQTAPFYITDQHSRVPELIVASPVAMEALGQRDLALIRRAAADAVFFQRAAWAQYEADTLTKLKAFGVAFLEPGDLPAWQQQARKIWTRQSPGVQELLHRIRNTQ